MATIATVVTALPLVLDAIPSIVMFVEKVFGVGNGALKQAAATTMVNGVHNALVDAGKVSGPPPDVNVVHTAIDAAVGALNTQGALQGTATQVPGTSGSVSPLQKIAALEAVLAFIKS